MAMKRTKTTVDAGRGFRPLAAAWHRRQSAGDRQWLRPEAFCRVVLGAAIDLCRRGFRGDRAAADRCSDAACRPLLSRPSEMTGVDRRHRDTRRRRWSTASMAPIPMRIEARREASTATSCWPAASTSRTACANAISSDRTAMCSCRAAAAICEKFATILAANRYFNHIGLKFRHLLRLGGR